MDDQQKQLPLINCLRYIAQGKDAPSLYRLLHDEMGFTNQELMDYSMSNLREQFRYEWNSDDPRLRYAMALDQTLPASDVMTTSRWINYLAELSHETQTDFDAEMDGLIRGMSEITFPVRGVHDRI